MMIEYLSNKKQICKPGSVTAEAAPVIYLR